MKNAPRENWQAILLQIFAIAEEPDLSEMRTMQICQAVSTTFAILTMRDADTRLGQLFGT